MLKIMAKYSKGYRIISIITPILVFIDAYITIKMPDLMGKIIDEIYLLGTGATVKSIMPRILQMLLLSVGTLLLGYIAARCSAIAQTGFGANLRGALFNKVFDLSFENIDKLKISSLITRMTSDVSSIQSTYGQILVTFVKGPYLFILALIKSIEISKQLSSVFKVALPSIFVALLLLAVMILPMMTKMLKTTDNFNGVLRDNIGGIRVVKSFVREELEKEKFKKANDALRQATIKAQALVLILMPVLTLVIYGCMVWTMYHGATLIIFPQQNGSGLTTGELTAFVSYISQVISSMMTILTALLSIVTAQASNKRIKEIFQTQPTVKDDEADPNLKIEDGSIEFKNVSFKYVEHEQKTSKVVNALAKSLAKSSTVQKKVKSKEADNKKDESSKSQAPTELEQPEQNKDQGTNEDVKKETKKPKEQPFALKDVSFKISSGEHVGIIGATGSSKSTLISLIPRLYDATDGEVLVSGHNVKEYKFDALRNEIATTMQQNVLFKSSIKENIRWGKLDATDDEIIDAAKKAQAYDFIMEKPNGFDEILSQGGTNVSGGQRQRICIARAMLKHPKIMIFDDSTSAVDTETDTEIRSVLNENEFKGTTVLTISSRVTSIMDCDKIIVLDHGQVIGIGTHEELKASCDIYRDIFVAQQKGVLA